MWVTSFSLTVLQLSLNGLGPVCLIEQLTDIHIINDSYHLGASQRQGLSSSNETKHDSEDNVSKETQK